MLHFKKKETRSDADDSDLYKQHHQQSLKVPALAYPKIKKSGQPGTSLVGQSPISIDSTGSLVYFTIDATRHPADVAGPELHVEAPLSTWT